MQIYTDGLSTISTESEIVEKKKKINKKFKTIRNEVKLSGKYVNICSVIAFGQWTMHKINCLDFITEHFPFVH